MSKQRIRELNDAFRSTFVGGRVLITAGVDTLSDDQKALAIAKVKRFSDFTESNDPHHEHDFGAFKVGGQKLFWKIDAYDLAMEFGSENPSDPAKTTRVLTIMLAEECAPGKLARSSEVEDLALPHRAGCG